MWLLAFSFLVLSLHSVDVSLQEAWAGTSNDPPWKRLLTGDQAKRVAELEHKIYELYEAGHYGEAREPARQAFEIRVREQGPTHWQTISAKNNLDIFIRIASLPKDAQDALTEVRKLEKTELPRLQREGRYREAIPVAERLVAIRQRYLGEDSSLVATALNAQGIFCYEAAQYTRAETLYRKALAISKKVHGDAHPNTAAAYGNLAMSLEVQDKYQEAREAKEKGLQIQLQAHGDNSEAVAIAYNNLASNSERQGQYGDAETGYRKALEILGPGSGDDNEQKIATARTNLAGVLNRQAKYAEAERGFHEALRIKRRLFGDDHPEMAFVYNDLGVCLADQGRYTEAEPLYRKALEIRCRTLGEAHLLTLQSYNNLAVALGHRGKLAEAELLLRRALHVQSSVAGERNQSTAVWQNNLAHNLQAQGRHAEAQELLEQGLANLRRIFGEEHPDTALITIDLAVALSDLEKYDQAEPLFRAAVKSLRGRLGEKHPLATQAYGNLGGNLYYQGKYAEAELIHKEALAIYQQVFGPRHPNTAWAYKNAIIDLWVQGKYSEAEQLCPAAAESFEGARRKVGFAGLERTTFAADNSPLPLLAALAARSGKSSTAWRYLEHNLARGLLDDLAARPWTEEERERELRLSREIEQLDNQISAVLSTPQVTESRRQKAAELTRQRDQRQQELSELQAELARKYGVAAGEVFELARIQSHLPADAALVAWVDYGGQPKGHDPNGEHWVCVIRHTGPPIWVRLAGDGKDGAWTDGDGKLAAQLRQQCASRPTMAEIGNELTRKLYRQRLAPLEQHLAAGAGLPPVRHLIILPSPHLRGIPIEVLTEEAHPGRYTVSYAPSGTMFAWLQEKRALAGRGGQASPLSKILAVGDPVFGAVKPRIELPPPPEHGILIAAVTPHSNAAKSGLKAGDVLLRYAQLKLNSAADLESALGNAPQPAVAGQKSISVQVWRDGESFECKVEPGPLGVLPSKTPAGQAVRAQRELDQLMRRSSAAEFNRLHGAEREMRAVTGVFRTATVLKGSEASEQNLRKLAAEGRLAQFRTLHFATHGVLDGKSPMQSALILSQDQLPDPFEQALAGKPTYDGRLTAEQVLRGWRLDADLVTLSACETGLGKYAGGEGYLGFSQALFLAGARSLVLSLWKVDDASTALLMTRFYENLMGRRPGLKEPIGKAQALAEAKSWLRGLKAEEVEQVSGGLIRGLDTDTARGTKRTRPAKQVETPASLHPYSHSYYWAAFILIGDPR
jgi:tetratricopeptide (TPR) repeat protein